MPMLFTDGSRLPAPPLLLKVKARGMVRALVRLLLGAASAAAWRCSCDMDTALLQLPSSRSLVTSAADAPLEDKGLQPCA